MRLYKVVVVVVLALGLGFLAGYLWWERDVARLGRELLLVKQRAASSTGVWASKGVVRGVFTEKKMLFITHEEIPGLMTGMTMGFPAQDPKLLRGLAPGDVIHFTLRESDNQLMIVAISRDSVR